MRQFIALILLSLLLLPMGTRPICQCEGPSTSPPTAADLCRDDATNLLEAASIEDGLLESRLLRQGAALIQRGETIEGHELIRQLDASHCQLDIPHSTAANQEPAELYRYAKDSVVIVAGLYKCRNCTRWHTTTASGFVISASGAVVTSYHVVDSSIQRTMVVMTADGQVYPVQGIFAASRADDLAVLKVPAPNLKPLPLADTPAAALVGSDVSVISHPDGRFFCYTSGVVSRYMKMESEGEQIDAVAITADYARGSSGAPVINRQGQVIGVVQSTDSVYYTEDGPRQMNLQMVFKNCIPSTSLLKLIRPRHQMAVN